MTARIQQINDAFRTCLSTDLGRILMTSGVASLDAETPALILSAVHTYDQFDEGIDPYVVHDMGRFAVCSEEYYRKIDYYDRNLEFHSPDPADPSVTIRVLTALDGDTPSEITSETINRCAGLNQFQWQSHCRGLFQLPVAA